MTRPGSWAKSVVASIKAVRFMIGYPLAEQALVKITEIEHCISVDEVPAPQA